MTIHSSAELEEAITRGSDNWQRYRDRHGERALSSYLFMVEPGRGFPVLIKAEFDDQVELIILQTGAVFSVELEEFERHRGDPFVLRPESRDTDAEAFDRYSKWFANAYATLGLCARVDSCVRR